MPQAALPDLNTQWIINSKEFWISLKNSDFTKAFGALYDVNAMLPKDYQVRISDIEYNDLIKQDTLLLCPFCSTNCQHCQEIDKGANCTAEIKRSEVKIKRVETSFTIKLLSDKKTDLRWNCPKCENSFRLSTTKKFQTKLAEPYFLQVVPNPPARKDGIINRKQYPKLVKRWLLMFQTELQHQMSNFRINYQPKDTQSEEEVMDGREDLDDLSDNQ